MSGTGSDVLDWIVNICFYCHYDSVKHFRIVGRILFDGYFGCVRQLDINQLYSAVICCNCVFVRNVNCSLPFIRTSGMSMVDDDDGNEADDFRYMYVRIHVDRNTHAFGAYNVTCGNCVPML